MFGQHQNLPDSANNTSPFGVPKSGFGSGPAAPTFQHTSAGLFGGNSPAVHNTSQSPHTGVSGSHSFKPTTFGSEIKTNGGSGPFGNTENTNNIRQGSPFSHILPSVSDVFPKRPEQKTSGVPHIRVVEDQAVNFGSKILTIHVGDGERAQNFSFHSDLLTARSSYFNDFILNNSEQNTIHLPAISPQVFALYFQLVYTGYLPSKANDSSNSDHDEYALLCKLYTIAHSVKDTKAANSALSAIFARSVESTELPSSEHVRLIYAGTDGPCGARRMMVDFYTYEATGDFMKTQGEDAHGQGFPPEFWSELAMSLVAKRGVPDRRMTRMNAEQYHGE